MPSERQIIVSRDDFDRLNNLFFSRFTVVLIYKPYLQPLRGELNIAKVLPPDQIPTDVATMNSTVRLRDVHSKVVETYTLVDPEDANIAECKLSVLAPIRTAILGYRVGDLVRWQVPRGTIHLQIEELVFQPERDRVAA